MRPTESLWRLRAGSLVPDLKYSRQRMAKSPYLTAPLKTDKMPPGIPYIVGNEAAERFSFYGMNSILVTFMTKYMLDSSGAPDHLTEARAKEWYHTFMTVNYFLPIFGAILADAFWGERYGQITDPFGHRWGLAQHIRNVSREEIARAAADLFG